MARRDRRPLFGKPRPSKPTPITAKAPGQPDSKLEKVRAAVAAEDWHAALRLAKELSSLGEDEATITRAWEALVRPAFLKQIKRDPDVALAEGVATLRKRFS